MLGCLLVVLVLALFLFDWRAALISLVTIPLSLVAAGLVLYWRGATINTMVLAGLVIALGAVVDDAIIDVENIVRRLRQHRARRQHRVDGADHPRRVARGPQRDRLRDADRGRSPLLPIFLLPGPDRRVLPAARGVVRARRRWSRWSSR